MNFSQIGTRPSSTGVRLDVGAGKRLVDRAARGRSTRGSCPNTSPKTMRRCVPVCTMRPGDFERGRDVGRAAERARLAGDRGDLARAVDAVLQRQDDRVVAEHRRQQRQRRRVVVGLDRDEHEIDRTDLRRVLLGAAARDEVAERGALDLEAPLADGRQVRAARDEGDVVSGAGRAARRSSRRRRPIRESLFSCRSSLDRFDRTSTPARPSARRPKPARDSVGRSSSVFNTNVVEAAMNTAGTNGYPQTRYGRG